MFRYYQKGDFNSWKIKACDGLSIWDFAKLNDADRVSVLEVSIDPDLAINGIIPEYAGNLMFDIDHSDLSVALDSSVRLCNKLIDYGIPADYLEINLSGSKGVHIYIDEKIMGVAKHPAIPAIHKKTALQLYVTGMDLQIYNEGKGRLVRPPNAKRPDGRYKVPVTYEELLKITPESYIQYVSEPREPPDRRRPKYCKSFGDLVERIKKEHLKKPPASEVKSAVEAKQFGIQTPPCIDFLASGKRKDGANFNQVALQLACFTARSEVYQDSNALQSLHERVTDNNPKKQGIRSVEEVKAAHLAVANDLGKYKFTCGAMRTVIDSSICSKCFITTVRAEEIAVDTLKLYERGGNLYSDKEGVGLLGTFTIERESVMIDSETGRIVASAMVIKSSNPLSDPIRFPDFIEDSFSNVRDFKREIAGYDGISWFGYDTDVTKLRRHIAMEAMMGGVEMVEIVREHKLGIVYRPRPGKPGRFTYVEPRFSTNAAGILGTHHYSGGIDVDHAPSLRKLTWNKPIGEKSNEVFQTLMEANTPKVMAPVLGWYILQHLKTHFLENYGQGAILCISGSAGTGKNSLIKVMQRLSGLEGKAAAHTLEAPNTTKVPMQQALAGRTTIPVVLNELNEKSISSHAKYREFIEILKACWDAQSSTRGKLGGGDRLGSNVSAMSWKMVAPLVTLSEEPISDTAVMQRTVRVNLSPAGRDNHAQNFFKVEKDADCLLELARVFTKEALSTTLEEVKTRMSEAMLPSKFDSANVDYRLKFCYQSILMAYDWAIDVLQKEEYGVQKRTIEGLKNLRTNFLDVMLSDGSNICAAAGVTECDKTIRAMGMLAYDGRAYSKIERGKHYATVGDELYLDVLLIYPALIRDKSTRIGIKNSDAFMEIVSTMPYFISGNVITPALNTNNRGILSLSISKMTAKGIPVGLFV